jgi:hypothetical protein
VNAHIRHQYTNYDKLLASGMPWFDARRVVTPACIKKLKEWRGEDGKVEIEESWEEWIDLRDESDDDNDHEDDQMSEPESPYGSDSYRQINNRRLPAVKENFFVDDSMRAHRNRPHSVGSAKLVGVKYLTEQHYEPVYPSVERSPTSPYASSHPHLSSRHSLLTHPSSSRPLQSQPHRQLHYTQNDRADEYNGPTTRLQAPGSRGAHLEVIDLTSSPQATRYQEIPSRASQRHSFPGLYAGGRSNSAVPLQFVPNVRGDISKPGYVASGQRPGPHRRILSSGSSAGDRATVHGTAYHAVPDYTEHAFLGATPTGARPGREVITNGRSDHRSVTPPHPEVPTTGWTLFKGAQKMASHR